VLLQEALGVLHMLADRSDILELPEQLAKNSLSDLVYALKAGDGRHRYVMNLEGL
jgi:hypothetical protein